MPVFAQAQFTKMDVTYNFGDQIVFQATLHTDQPVKNALLFFQAQGDSQTYVEPLIVTPTGSGFVDLAYVHDLAAQPLRPFSKVDYWLEITQEAGEKLTSPVNTFFYEDNRYEWQSLKEGVLRVHWHIGETRFAQSVLDIAQQGVTHIRSLLPVEAPQAMDIYIYPNASTMQEALDLAELEWVAGHAEPDLGVLLVSLPPGPDQQILAEQRVPHELMHILLFQATGVGYDNLPTWLSEGLASVAELYPNPDYQVLLEGTYARSNLLTLSSLCQSFPRDASGALLAYAQSASFMRYLYSTYGAPGLKSLVDDYASGMSCERGAQAALGVGLDQLEKRWRQEVFHENIAGKALTNMVPWLLFLAVVLAAPIVLISASLLRRSSPGVNV